METIDLAREVQSPFSDPAARASGLAWSRDSSSIYFTLWGEAQSQVLVRRVDAAAAARPVITSRDRYDVTSVRADGKTLAGDHWAGTVARGIGFAMGGQLPWKTFESGNAVIRRSQFSPDGKWLLYQSNESGAFEVYISDFPGLVTRRRLSIAGGSEPRWSRDGKEIFYIAPGGLLMSAAVEDPLRLTFSAPRTLFRLPGQVQGSSGFSYDISHDARHFLALNTFLPAAARDLSVVFNWPQLMGAGTPR